MRLLSMQLLLPLRPLLMLLIPLAAVVTAVAAAAAAAAVVAIAVVTANLFCCCQSPVAVAASDVRPIELYSTCVMLKLTKRREITSTR